MGAFAGKEFSCEGEMCRHVQKGDRRAEGAFYAVCKETECSEYAIFKRRLENRNDKFKDRR